MKEQIPEKIAFQGVIRSVQPRSNVWRYRLDNRTHSMTGYNIFLTGVANETEGDFSVAISEKQYEKLCCHIGDEINGTAWTKKYPEWEYADYYRAGALKKLKETPVSDEETSEPWIGDLPALSVYDWRGCRGYTGALKAPVRCFGNHLSGQRKSQFRTDNECGEAAILKNRTSRMGTPVGC